jgi:hypothetical protein
VTWRLAQELVTEVISEDDVVTARDQLMIATGAHVDTRWPDNDLKRVTKEYEGLKERAHTLPRLIPMLEALRAVWRFENHGFQFKFPEGHILCWWPQTGSRLWQGKPLKAVRELGVLSAGPIEGMLQRYTDYAKAADVPVASGVPVCLVCGGTKADKACEGCGEVPDLCAPCWPNAHWCPAERSA